MKLSCVAIVSTLWLMICAAKSFAPKITKNELPGLPHGLVYFNDSSVLLYHSGADGHVYRSENDGESWDQVKVSKEALKVESLIEHPFDKERAYVITPGKTHYATRDRGESWYKFEIPQLASSAMPISFHAEEPEYVLFSALECKEDKLTSCKPVYYYSVNNFDKVNKLNADDAYICSFARSSPDFKQGKMDTVVCAGNSQIQVSNDFFRSIVREKDVKEEVVGLGAAGKFFVVAVALDIEQVELYVSTDLEQWTLADFGGEKISKSYTILESSSHSLHIDVVSSESEGKGTFYTSNSEGTHFTRSLENTRRNSMGMVDIEKVDGIDGVLIANVIDGRKTKSKISFDDGRTWNALKAEGSGNVLHLHSVTDHHNIGRIFSSPAPGIIAGIGNLGDHLEDFSRADMYISHDSGLTWKASHDDAQLYEFGDQGNVMISMYDGPSDKGFYSLDRGDTWKSFSFNNGDKVHPKLLFTTPDSTGLTFICIGEVGGKYKSMTIDFTGIYSRKCDMDGDDFEKWYARYDVDKKPSCLMGRKQFFWRKKTSAECVVGDLYHEQHASSEPCKCSAEDFECDKGYTRQNGFCIPTKGSSNDNDCKPGQKIKRPSGLRKIAGNECIGEPEKEVEQDCFAASAEVGHKEHTFDGAIFDYFYLRSEKENSDETMLLRTDKRQTWITHDQGGKWEQMSDDDIIAMYPHPEVADYVYLVNDRQELLVSKDRAKDFRKYKLPSRPNAESGQLFSFHHEKKDWILYHGEEGCDNPFSSKCRMSVHYTTDGGATWNELHEHASRCAFINNGDLVMCEVRGKSGSKALVSSDNWFRDSKTHFENIIGFAIEHEFIIVAAIDDKGNSLKAYASIDGKTFAAADFPHNFHVDRQQAYTVLESRTNSIFMHVTVNDRRGSEYGAILKSNTNGTHYVMSLEHVNRNEEGFVDFEKMEGLEGVAIVNEVSNVNEIQKGGGRKKLKTMITHNDGGQWNFIDPPNRDGCSGHGLEGCSLNLHGFTERDDYRDTFSSQSAVGLMMGVGNVGAELTDMEEANTYLTRDGGVTWIEVAKGAHKWEFGDSGSIVVIVNHHDPTNTVKYSLDLGQTWKEYKFSEDMMNIDDIATIPSDRSRKFLLFGRTPASKGRKSISIQLDFTGLTDKQCKWDPENPDSSDNDFELWTPSHPELNGCLFGHEAQYYRKIPDRQCYVGRSIEQPHKILQNCTCTRQDFECDFNFYRDIDGTCKLVPGFNPPDHSKVCKELPDQYEYWEPTGYRRIPLSTCQGGKELDKIESHPCPGKEKEYEEKHRGLHGFALFFVIVLPIGMTGMLVAIVWDHYSKRYGQIRLGEENDDQPIFMQYLAIAVAGVVAVVAVIPTLGSRLFDQIRQRLRRPSRYTSRGAFASSYTPVDTAENELLRDSDEEDEDDLEIHSD